MSKSHTPITKEAFSAYQHGLGRRLKALRKASGMTQAQVGDRLDVSRVAIGYFEQGRRTPSLMTLYDLAKLYGVTISELTDIK